MGRFIATKDWSLTPLGPLEDWPQSLRTTVSLCLASNFPISIAWGKEFTQIYNDGYWPICGAKHPVSMGQDFRECWASPWPAIGGAFESAAQGRTSFLEDQRMFLDRNGYMEETFFTFSFSPIRDESGGIGGLFHPVTETTGNMLGARRTRTLRDLTAVLARATSLESVFSLAAEALAECAFDLPFVLQYRFDEASGDFVRMASTGLSPEAAAALDAESPRQRSERWRMDDALRTLAAVHVESLDPALASVLPGPYPEPPRGAIVTPILVPGKARPIALVIAGTSSRLPLDELYRAFHGQVASAITAGATNALIHEEQRLRAEALAEIDRAKTLFFSNVSHEFRTPLTLMLGPLEATLAGGNLDAAQRASLDLAHRNSLRLLKLVNTLLDFSRLEAGRLQAIYRCTDLAVLTADLASNFRSTMEAAGLRFVVDIPPEGVHGFVDRDMWERIVLNLLSNAFKFTFKGEVRLTLRQVDDRIELAIGDTGTGIPPSEVPHLFERFRRVEGSRSRSHEGTGIGLAMVQELAKLHGGDVSVESIEGQGSTFRVRIPSGRDHLPAAHVGETLPIAATTRAETYVKESLGWLGTESEDAPNSPDFDAEAVAPAGRKLIVLADDNADMRTYVRNLLGSRYEVLAAADGDEALRLIHERMPALVLADVMMPRLDGFGLLARVRADERTRGIPLVLLSARAGEEARAEGLEAGADDYMVKPFAARELLARVQANIGLAQLRAEVERAAGREEVLEVERRHKDEFLATLAHELRNPLAPLRNAIELMRRDAVTAERRGPLLEMMQRQLAQLVRLVDDLLEIARVNSGLLELRSAPVAVATIVRDAVETTEPVVSALGHRLVVDVEDEHLLLIGDGVRLAQILSNLLNNAAKYTPPGGSIRIQSRRHEANVAITVSDSGVGIASTAMPSVFSMFSRAGRTGLNGEGGLGIGLALALKIAQMHGGTLEAQSEGAGRGSAFTLTLPLAKAA